MSSQPRAPTKQIRSYIVDPRRPITGTAAGTTRPPLNPGRFILTIPDTAWINQPAAKTESEPPEAEQAA